MAIWYFVAMIFFWYVVIFACAPGIYFDILVAFIIVMLYEVYYFWYVVSSLFSYCISYFGILLVFFLYFVFLSYVLYLVYCYLAILYCIFVYLYEYAFLHEYALLYLVFGISVLAVSLLVFLYVSSSVRARTRYVRTVVMLSWIRGDGRRVL